jgi:hypothetical protein
MIKKRMYELQAGSSSGAANHIESLELNIATAAITRSGGK